MNRITVMAIVVIMASMWEYSNAGIRISWMIDYLNVLRICQCLLYLHIMHLFFHYICIPIRFESRSIKWQKGHESDSVFDQANNGRGKKKTTRVWWRNPERYVKDLQCICHEIKLSFKHMTSFYYFVQFLTRDWSSILEIFL